MFLASENKCGRSTRLYSANKPIEPFADKICKNQYFQILCIYSDS